MSSLRNFRWLLIILHIVISAENLKSQDNVTTTELPVSSTSSSPVCISPIDIIRANIKGEATIPFPEEVREIKVTLEKIITWDSNGVTLGLMPVEKEDKTTPLSLLTNALTANTTAASADINASPLLDTSSFQYRIDICTRNGDYCYLHSEIHWGTTNQSGFDHTVDGRRSPLEIQHFFLNSSFEKLAILGIGVRYRIIQDNVVNAKVFHNGPEMNDYLGNNIVDDALMRREREANDGKIVPGNSTTPSDKVSSAKSINSTERSSFATNVHMNDNVTLTATSNASHFGTIGDLLLNLSSTTANNPGPIYNKTLRKNLTRLGLSYLSQDEFKAFLKGDLKRINVTLGDFLMPPGEGYYQYRGNYIGECELKVDWLLYVKEDMVLSSVLQLLRQLYSPSDTTELQQTSHHRMQRSVDVFRWPYPEPFESEHAGVESSVSPDHPGVESSVSPEHAGMESSGSSEHAGVESSGSSAHAGVESSGSRLRYFNPIVFLAIPIIVLLAFFIL